MAASREKILKAQLLWSDIQEKMSGSEWEGFIKKYGNPLVPPVDETRLDEFILGFSEIYLGKQTPDEIAKGIDNKKLGSFVEEYERESKKIEELSGQADKRAKIHLQEIMRHTLEARVPASQKETTYKLLKEKSEEQPNIPVEKIASRVVTTIEDAQPFFQKEEDVADFVKEQSFFSKLKGRNIIQKAASPIADAVITVFPDLRQGVLNKNFEAELQKILKAPEALIDKLGIKAVDTDAFKLMARRVQTGLSQTSRPGGARTFIDDVTASVFHKSFTITAEQSVVTYWEVVRTSLMQDKPIPSANQFMASGMGMGSSLVHMGVNMGISEVKGAALRSIATKLGIGAIEGFSGPLGWAAALLQIGGGLLGKVGGWMKKLAGIKEGMVPGDLEIVSIGCGAILLVFFILPIVSQLNIDSSLVTRLGLGGTNPSTSSQPGGGGGLPAYPGAPLIPSDITGCPTKNAFSLSQCPGSKAYSHSNLWAYDIYYNGSTGIPIYATHNGVIAVTTKTSQSGGYGNMVEIKGQTPQGSVYYTLYGHLANWTVSMGQQVKAGDLIGYGDNTGHSTGAHLHYEYRGPSNTASGDYGVQFMPAACVSNPGYCNLK